MITIKGKWDSNNHRFYIPEPNIDFNKVNIVSFFMGEGDEVFLTYEPLNRDGATEIS